MQRGQPHIWSGEPEANQATRPLARGFRLLLRCPVHASRLWEDPHPAHGNQPFRLPIHLLIESAATADRKGNWAAHSVAAARGKRLPTHWLEVFSGGALVEDEGALASGTSPSLARKAARTSGGSPSCRSSMRLRTSRSISSKGFKPIADRRSAGIRLW